MVNNSLDLVFMALMKEDPSWDGKGNILGMMDIFSQFSVTVIMPNQQANTVAKALLDKWFYICRVPAWIHGDQGKILKPN